jgi:hypothetical protein
MMLLKIFVEICGIIAHLQKIKLKMRMKIQLASGVEKSFLTGYID